MSNKIKLMEKKKMKRQFTIFSLLMIIAVIASACATPTPQTVEVTKIVAGTPEKVVITATPEVKPTTLPAGSVKINGSGATFPLPVYTDWTYAFSYVDPSVAINYQGIGSGGGKKAIVDGTVDFAGSDSLVTDAEYTQGKDLQMYPMVAGAVVAIYNVEGITTPITLDRDTLVGIYSAKITTWNDPAIVALNPDLKDKLPNKTITVVHRSDGSGTTEIFTKALASFSEDWKKNVGAGSAVEWPVDKAKNGVGGKGNQGVTAAVLSTPNSIGYVELSFALANGTPTAQMVNKAKKTVKPNAESVQAAMADFANGFDAKLTATIVDAPGEKSWPITGYTYLVLHQTSMTDCVKAKKLLEYINWTLSDTSAAKRAGELGYSVLPSDVKAKVTAKLGEVTCGGKPVMIK